ncbi:unnamed protein product, partial [Iphiclides podalirius]
MSYYLLVMAFSWFGGVRLQYISAGDASETLTNPPTTTFHYPPLPYSEYFNPPERDNFDNSYDVPTPAFDQFYQSGESQRFYLKRNRRMSNRGQTAEVGDRRWQPKLEGFDRGGYLTNQGGDETQYFVENVPNNGDENATDAKYEKALEKNFGQGRGKRDAANLQHMWTWKREMNVREPNMPKRVRFSPWGGKRSGQIVHKSAKGSKIIFSTSIPQLTRIVTNYSPKGEQTDLKGFQFVPARDKRHPIKILTLSTKVDERTLREALPYKAFIESIPKLFKPGNTYTDVALKSDGKRKVKFSAWGGKRSPPIIGPIWTPAPQNIKESTLDTIILIRNNPEQAQLMTKEY